MTTTSRQTHNFPWRLNGRPIYDRIVTFLGILLCHKLIQILCQGTFEWLDSATKSGFLNSIVNRAPWEYKWVGMWDNGIPEIACKIPIYIPSEKFTVKHYGVMWDPIKTKQKNWSKNIKSSTVRTISDAVNMPGCILSFTIVYNYYMYAFNIINFRWSQTVKVVDTYSPRNMLFLASLGLM